VLLSCRKQDEGTMERAFAQLRTFYHDTRSLGVPFANELSMQVDRRSSGQPRS
jgi:26S proteasome regulatory subunit N12